MKRNLLFPLASFALILSLASCGSGETPAEESSLGDSSPIESSVLQEGVNIEISPLPTIALGEELDLTQYISATINGKASVWDYYVLTDNAHKTMVNTISTERPNVGTPKVLQAIRPGRVVIKVYVEDSYKIAYFDIVASDRYQEISDYLESHDVNNYTLELGGVPTFYKTESYLYYPDYQYGLAINAASKTSHYFVLSGVDEKYASTFHAGANSKTYASYETLTPATFLTNYPTFSSLFSGDEIAYVPNLAKYFGEDYAYAMLYDSSDTTNFDKAVSLLGLSSSIVYGSYYYYVSGFAINIEDDESLAFNVIYCRSKGNVASTSLLSNPYRMTNVGSTSIAVVDEFVEGPALSVATSPSSIAERLSGVTSYTTYAEGHYEDGAGNKVEAPSYFASGEALPEIEVSGKFASNGMESTRLDWIDGGSDKHVLLYNGTVGGNNRVIKYVLNDEGKYTSSDEYGKDPSSGTTLTTWQGGSTFSYYKPTVIFSSTLWKYPSFTLTDEEGVYELMGYNDVNARSAIEKLVTGTSSSKFSGSSSPFYYYHIYAWAEIDMGTAITDDITGHIETRLIDSSTGDICFYVYNFAFTNINSTTISIPDAA